LGTKSMPHEVRTRARRVTFMFPEALDLAAGDSLVLSL
jgi:hypothetical protein